MYVCIYIYTYPYIIIYIYTHTLIGLWTLSFGAAEEMASRSV